LSEADALMRTLDTGAAILLATLAVVLEVRGQDPQPSFEAAAARLRPATVTVRVWNPQTPDAVPVDAGSTGVGGQDDTAPPRSIVVCTGVAVTRSLIVTPIYAASDSKIRVTLVDGVQAKATLRVIDEYSGLALVETDEAILTPVSIAAEEPKTGSWVLSAAAWSTEQPAVSFGVVGATDRTLPGTGYPPLLQCDLRATQTSSGAAVVNQEGRLLGVTVVADPEHGNRGWVYAAPVRHVLRLLRVKSQASDSDSVAILKRRRPVVGMVLDGDAEEIRVSRVQAGSPAARAGIRVGDRLLEVDGVKVRAVYQAVRTVLFKQPGDLVVFTVEQQEGIHAAEVVLGGGVELPSAPFANLGRYVRPRLDIQQLEDGRYALRTGQSSLREVAVPSPPVNEGPDTARPVVTAVEKIQLLEKALDRYQQAIVFLRDQLNRQQREREQTDQQLRALQAEIDRMKQRMESTEP
jgi:S1-C subfamily serine protease